MRALSTNVNSTGGLLTRDGRGVHFHIVLTAIENNTIDERRSQEETEFSIAAYPVLLLGLLPLRLITLLSITLYFSTL